MATTTLNLGVMVTLLLPYLIYRYILHPAFISPLSKVRPAHFTSHFLPTWIWWRRRTGRESRSIAAAHRRCGSIVRLGPNEVSVASQEGLKKVYYSSFTRTEWILAFRNYDNTPNLVTMIDPREHATRKRMLHNLYSKSYLLRSADFCSLSHTIIFGRLLPSLVSAADMGQRVDVFAMGCAMAAEMMSAYEVGVQNGLDLMSLGREAAKKAHLENGKTKLRELKGWKEAAKALEDECLTTCVKADEMLKRIKSLGVDKTSFARKSDASLARPTGETYPVVFAQLISSIPTKEGVQSRENTLRLVASELLDNVEAARVGIGVVITYAMYELCRRTALLAELKAELKAISPPLTHLPHEGLSKSVLQQIDALPLLDAIIMETLRVYSPAPGPLYRGVPEGGVIVDGYFIPAGVIISSSPYHLHRHAGAFPDAEEWLPERWTQARDGKTEKSGRNATDAADLEKDASQGDMRRWFWAFGNGGRMCNGSNFAIVSTKLILACIYANFTTTIVDDEGIEQRDELPADPVGDKLILGFHREASAS